jgi:hypothetical protein
MKGFKLEREAAAETSEKGEREAGERMIWRRPAEEASSIYLYSLKPESID